MASISSKTPSPSVLDLKLRNSHINNLILRRFLLHRIITEGSITYFVLQCITADGAFDVALVNPVDVCEIFRRRWGPSLALVKELAARGIEFIVCSRRPANAPFRQVTQPRARQFGGLGYRPAGYHPGREDWLGYVSSRDEFLRGPRGHLAFQAGGLIARIAHDVMLFHFADFPDSEEGVCEYDKLTSNEIDLICGVYYIDTGKYIFISSNSYNDSFQA
jgi:hypothetical protein